MVFQLHVSDTPSYFVLTIAMVLGQKEIIRIHLTMNIKKLASSPNEVRGFEIASVKCNWLADQATEY